MLLFGILLSNKPVILKNAKAPKSCYNWGNGSIGAFFRIVFANNDVEILLYDVNKESLSKLMFG